jgi:hypothetical protein
MRMRGIDEEDRANAGLYRDETSDIVDRIR